MVYMIENNNTLEIDMKLNKKVIFQTDETRIKKVSYITPDGNKVSRYAEIKNGKIIRFITRN